MKTAQILKEERLAKKQAGDAMITLAETEKREFTPEERTTFNAISSEIDALDVSIADAETREKFKARNIATIGAPADPKPDAEKREMANFDFAKVISASHEKRAVDGLERELIDESAKEARQNGFKVGGIYISKNILDAVQLRAMSAGSATAGGNFIQTDKKGFFDVLRANRVLDKVGANWETGLMANVDYTGFSTGWTFGSSAENGTAPDADPVTVNRSISPKRISGKVYVSNQLITQDPSFNSKILMSLQNALYPYVEQMVLVGSGSSNQMTGITANATAATVALGTNGGAPSLSYVQNMKKTLLNGNVNQSNIYWLINPNTEALLQTTTIDAGSGAMIIPYMSYFNGEKSDGYISNNKYLVTSNLPNNLTKGTSSGNCSAVIVGDFSNLQVAQFGGLDLIVDAVTLAETGQTKIVANTYWDTTILRAGTIIKTLDLITG